MDNLASLNKRIKQAVANKVIGKILNTEAMHHFNHGWKTGCTCSVCNYRRDYAARQSLPNKQQHSYSTMNNQFFDSRFERRELNRVFKRKVLFEATGAYFGD
jgi:hypothetical protein